MLALCLALRDEYSIAAVTNDIFTREDAEFLTKHHALPPERIQYAKPTSPIPHLPPSSTYITLPIQPRMRFSIF